MGYRLLIVEGETAAVWTLTQKLALERTDLKFESFTNPHRALERLRQETPDLLMTDLNPSKISSFELLQQARQIEPKLPVLVMQSSLESAGRDLVLGYENIEYFEKPIDLKKFLETVNRLLPPLNQNSWQDVLAERTQQLVPAIKTVAENSRRTGFLDAPSIQTANKGTRDLLSNGVTTSQPFLPPKLQTSTPPSILLPDVPLLSVEVTAQMAELCTSLVNQVAGSLICAAVDLHRETLLTAFPSEPLRVNVKRLVEIAIEVFCAEGLRLYPETASTDEPAELQSNDSPQEIQLVFAKYLLFGKATLEGRLAILLLTSQEVNIGYSWYHLKAALSKLPT